MAENMSGKQAKAINALITTPGVPAAARAAGVSERTLYRWLSSPEFRAALLQAEGEAIDTAARRLLSLSETALDTLANVLEDSTIRADIRLRAVDLVLTHFQKLRELRNIEERLADLETKVYGTK